MRDRYTFIKRVILRINLWAAIAGLALAGCASSPPAKKINAEIKFHANSGYIAEQITHASSISETWMVGSDQVDVTLMMPSGKDAYPLVIYMPGLGESSGDGLAWRRTWSEAGYAVLSMQPTAMGDALRSSLRARTDDSRNIAKGYYSADSLTTRLTILRGVLDELNRRRDNDSAEIYRHVDLSRIAIAGFDVGALAAMVVAGERIEGVEPVQFPDAVKCVIALSPYADFSGMGVEQLFRSIHLPVLSVTSWGDTDQYGLVTSATVRRAPFQYMPPSQKYLLILSAAPHSLIAGNEKPTEDSKANESKDADRVPPDSGSDGRPSGSSGRRGGKKKHGGGKSGDRPSASRGQASSANWMELLIDAQSVTTAYLDATVKNDPMAWKWLSKDAKRWLGESADLLSK